MVPRDHHPQLRGYDTGSWHAWWWSSRGSGRQDIHAPAVIALLSLIVMRADRQEHSISANEKRDKLSTCNHVCGWINHHKCLTNKAAAAAAAFLCPTSCRAPIRPERSRSIRLHPTRTRTERILFGSTTPPSAAAGSQMGTDFIHEWQWRLYSLLLILRTRYVDYAINTSFASCTWPRIPRRSFGQRARFNVFTGTCGLYSVLACPIYSSIQECMYLWYRLICMVSKLFVSPYVLV